MVPVWSADLVEVPGFLVLDGTVLESWRSSKVEKIRDKEGGVGGLIKYSCASASGSLVQIFVKAVLILERTSRSWEEGVEEDCSGCRCEAEEYWGQCKKRWLNFQRSTWTTARGWERRVGRVGEGWERGLSGSSGRRTQRPLHRVKR